MSSSCLLVARRRFFECEVRFLGTASTIEGKSSHSPCRTDATGEGVAELDGSEDDEEGDGRVDDDGREREANWVVWVGVKSDQSVCEIVREAVGAGREADMVGRWLRFEDRAGKGRESRELTERPVDRQGAHLIVRQPQIQIGSSPERVIKLSVSTRLVIQLKSVMRQLRRVSRQIGSGPTRTLTGARA